MARLIVDVQAKRAPGGTDGRCHIDDSTWSVLILARGLLSLHCTNIRISSTGSEMASTLILCQTHSSNMPSQSSNLPNLRRLFVEARTDAEESAYSRNAVC
jgi:hypothetical protein